MPHRDHVFRVVIDQAGSEAWYELAGARHGPFGSPEALELDLVARLRTWSDHARSLGGWTWRRSPLEVVVTLPADVPVVGGEPLGPWVSRRA